MKQRRVAVHVVRIVVYIAFFAAFDYLFMHQVTGDFPSDLPNHIKPPADDTYSALRILYQIIIGAAGVQGVCAFLALVEIAAIGMTEYLLTKLVPKANPWAVLVAAVACNFAVAIYLPMIHPYFCVGSPGGNCWHNSTYSVMKLLALATMLFYLKFGGIVACRSKVWSWALFTLLLTIATSVKPSFAIVFGPAVFALCVYDLAKGGKATVRHSLAVGLSLAIALAVVFYQLAILFPSDGSAEGGIAFGLAKVWRARHANIFVSFFQSLAFPLLVTAVCNPKFWKDRTLHLAWLMTIVAMAEYVFLLETGERTYHGNFGWGLSFALYYLFIIAAASFMRDRGIRLKLRLSSSALGGVCRYGKSSPDDAILQPAVRRALDVAVLVAFALHACSGFWYFVRVMLGHSYY